MATHSGGPDWDFGGTFTCPVSGTLDRAKVLLRDVEIKRGALRGAVRLAFSGVKYWPWELAWASAEPAAPDDPS